MNNYNGWANYETWRVNLEIFDNTTLEHLGYDLTPSLDSLADHLCSIAEEAIESSSQAGLARDYALAFLSDVNWLQIAERLIEDSEEDQEAA